LAVGLSIADKQKTLAFGIHPVVSLATDKERLKTYPVCTTDKEINESSSVAARLMRND
jgi:hypothetical protein